MPRRSGSNVALNPDPGVSKGSAGDHRPCQNVVATDRLDCGRDVIEMIMGFLGAQLYLRGERVHPVEECLGTATDSHEPQIACAVSFVP